MGDPVCYMHLLDEEGRMPEERWDEPEVAEQTAPSPESRGRTRPGGPARRSPSTHSTAEKRDRESIA